MITNLVEDLATEIAVVQGTSIKTAGEDGIVGEALDVIICAVDLIYQEAPYLEEEDLIAGLLQKLYKWKKVSKIILDKNKS